MIGFAIDIERQRKAAKINAILGDASHKETKGLKILDIGCGSGEITEFFSEQNTVYCVDVEDQRKSKAFGQFSPVTSEILPFSDSEMDIVITNHVIEHVSDYKLHLKEIHRVLKSTGHCYLACPNRIFPWETHYKIPLLHYLPYSFFHGILRMAGHYREDVYLLDYFKLKREVSKYFYIDEYTHQIVANPEKFISEEMIPSFMSGMKLRWLNPLSPTIILVLMKKS